MVDELRNVLGAAAADQLGAEYAARPVTEPVSESRQILEPFHQQVRIAVKVLLQIVQGQHEADGQALTIRVDETPHVEMQIPTAQRAVANQDLISGAFLRAQTEDAFNGSRRHVDHLLDALQELRSLALDRKAFITFAGDEMRSVAFGQEHQVGIERAALRTHPDDP